MGSEAAVSRVPSMMIGQSFEALVVSIAAEVWSVLLGRLWVDHQVYNPSRGSITAHAF